eukprot:Polyplicarium_translucidae@DN3320_c1_g1_i1.p1
MQFSRKFGWTVAVGVALTSPFARDLVEVPDQMGAEEVGHAGDFLAGGSPEASGPVDGGTRGIREWISPVDGKWVCNNCGYCTRQKSNMRMHISRVHLKAQNYSCNECEMRFNTKPDLTRHMRRHSDHRPFSCRDCGNTFKHSWSVFEHRKSGACGRLEAVKQEKTKLKAAGGHKCGGCGKVYSRSYGLRRHCKAGRCQVASSAQVSSEVNTSHDSPVTPTHSESGSANAVSFSSSPRPGPVTARRQSADQRKNKRKQAHPTRCGESSQEEGMHAEMP